MSKNFEDKKLKQWNKDFFTKRISKEIDFYHLNTSVINDLFPIDVGHEAHLASDPDIDNKFPYFLLHYVVKGKGSITIDGKKHCFGKNDLFVIPSNVKVFYYTDKKNPWEYYWINFNGLLAKKLLENLDFSSDKLGLTMSDTSIKKYFIKALEAKEKILLQPYIVTECLFGIFAKIAEVVSLHKVDSNKDLSLFEQIHNYTLTHLYESDLTAKKVSAQFFINPCYFSTLFRKNANVPFKQFVNYERIKKATHLIETTDMFIKEIAEAVGFTDPLYFSKIFKKYRLVSPEEYRNTKKEALPEK